MKVTDIFMHALEKDYDKMINMIVKNTTLVRTLADLADNKDKFQFSNSHN